MTPPSDEELMARYQRGDIAAFDRLYLRYEHRIYAYVLRLVGERERSAELFQETFLRLHRQRRSYDTHRPFGAWLFRIARNLAYNEIRRRQRSRRLFSAAVDLEAQVGRENPEEALDDKSLRREVEKALDSLSQEQREAIELRYYGGLKYADIAAVVGSTQDAVKQRTRRGMEAMRRQLQALFRRNMET